MNDIEIALTRINLNIVANHLLFRAKRNDISEDKRQNILTDVKYIDNALETIKTLSKAIEQQYTINSNLYLDNMRLKKELIKQQETIEL